MKNTQCQASSVSLALPPSDRRSGFSLLELMVAMAMFMIIMGATFSLFQRHMPVFNEQQNTAVLNMSLRNAVAQMQTDVVNAGSGFFAGANIAAWPIGVSITNGTGAGCHDAATYTYSQSCFDTLNVVTFDHSVNPARPSDVNGNEVDTTASSQLYLTPQAGTAADLAAQFKNSDALLLVTSNGQKMATVVLTANAQVAGNKVLITHEKTTSNGIDSDDPYGISTPADSSGLTNKFNIGDWAMRLAMITYKVDATDITNPKLVRRQNGADSVIAEQVIGFKVGAAVHNSASGNSSLQDYNWAASTFGADDPPGSGSPGYKYTMVRAVRLSLIGRTPPNSSAHSSAFHNTFDNGPYQIQSVSVVIHPRNLTMNDGW